MYTACLDVTLIHDKKANVENGKLRGKMSSSSRCCGNVFRLFFPTLGERGYCCGNCSFCCVIEPLAEMTVFIKQTLLFMKAIFAVIVKYEFGKSKRNGVCT